MKPTLQHLFIAQHLQDKYGHHESWPFSSAAEIEAELCGARLVLAGGDYLVVGSDHNGVRCDKARSLEDLTTFPSDSLIIPYHELERAFYDQYAEYVEL